MSTILRCLVGAGLVAAATLPAHASYVADAPPAAAPKSVVDGARSVVEALPGLRSGSSFATASDEEGRPQGDAVQRTVVAPVPEPETYALMAAGLGVLGLISRRRRQRR